MKLNIPRHWIYDRIHNGTIQIDINFERRTYLFPDTPETLAGFRQLRAEISTTYVLRRVSRCPIQIGFDIPLQDPARTGRTPKDLVTLIQGIGTAAFQSKAVGMAVGEGLCDGIEAQQVEGLHGPIGHGRNP